MRQNEGHWLWGQFTEKDTNYLNSLKNKVQSELKSPIFDIHITLTGPYKIINEQFLNSLRSFAKQNSSIDLKLKQFELIFCTCFFMLYLLQEYYVYATNLLFYFYLNLSKRIAK